jgi:S1-C subfamily serine protease
VNFIDFIIIGVTLAAIGRGVSTGLLRSFGSLGGFLLGVFLGALAAPTIASLIPSISNRPFVVLIIFFGIAMIVGGIGESIGAHGAGLMKRLGLGSVDGLLGGAFGLTAAILVMWLLSASFGSSAGPLLTADLQSSRILQFLDRTLPPAPDVTAKLERAIGASRFPKVFAGFEQVPAAPVTGPNAATVNAAVAAAGSATVKIEGAGCGGVVEGSGFVVADGYVVTNAHVVAGISSPYIYDANGRHRATVTAFDPDLDIAVLRTSGLFAAPLKISAINQDRGTVGAALGYPGGGPFTAGAAAILERQSATGRNIYDSGLTRRDIYVLQAVVRPGNSGGPLVTQDGTVIGVIFATSTTNPNLGYALTSTEVIPDIHAGEVSGPVSTGPCVAE